MPADQLQILSEFVCNTLKLWLIAVLPNKFHGTRECLYVLANHLRRTFGPLQKVYQYNESFEPETIFRGKSDIVRLLVRDPKNNKKSGD